MDPAKAKANHTPTIVGSVVALWVLAFVAIGFRFLGRRVGHTNLWWDDWLILAAAIIFIPAAVNDLIEAHLGAGKHVSEVAREHPGNIVNFLKCIYAGEIFYPPIMVCIKCSILALYLRLFGIRRNFAYVCYVLMAVTVAWGIATLLPAIFQCNPISTAWDPQSDRHNCFGLRAYLVGTNVPNVVLDLLVLLAPLYPIWKLNLPNQKKAMISGIFLLGAGEAAFSIIRLVVLTRLGNADVTWDYLTPVIWSTVELCVGMICASLPPMAPLIQYCRGRQRDKSTDASTNLGLSKKTGLSNTYGLQDFSKLEDGSTDSASAKDEPSEGIWKTTDIDVDRRTP